MVEGGQISVTGTRGGSLVYNKSKQPRLPFGGSQPYVAVCPKCGEISMYLINPEKVFEEK
jgi:hypothetical protein